MREGLLPDLVLAPRDSEPLGVDRQQDQRLAHVLVVPLEDPLHLRPVRGMEEPLLLEGPPSGGRGVGCPTPAPAPSPPPWRCGRSACPHRGIHPRRPVPEVHRNAADPSQKCNTGLHFCDGSARFGCTFATARRVCAHLTTPRRGPGCTSATGRRGVGWCGIEAGEEALQDSGGLVQREQGGFVAAPAEHLGAVELVHLAAARLRGSGRPGRWPRPGGAPRSRRPRAGSAWSGRRAGRRRAAGGCRGPSSAAPGLHRRPGPGGRRAARARPAPRGWRGVRRSRVRSAHGSSWRR